MDRALYIAMTGAKAVMQAQTLRANNLANANTTGFRADFEQARSMGVYYGDGYSTRAYAQTENPGTSFRQGPLNATGRDLDVAVTGNGWLAVQAFDGSEALTRHGSLRVDTLGQLTTANGLPVMGEAGPIAIPPAEKIQIGVDGTITIQPIGQTAAVLSTIDRIKLVSANTSQLQKGEDGLLRDKTGAPYVADGSLGVAVGFLEGSNVNAIDEMTNIIGMARQYEMHVKMMRTVDENSQSAVRLLQQNG